MPVSSNVIKPAIQDIVYGAKVASGITTAGCYYPGTDKESTQYLALLLFGYEASGSIDSPDTAERLLKWVYGSDGSGGMKGLKDIPTTPLFSPVATFYNADPIHVLNTINRALENIAVPVIPDRNGISKEESIRHIISSMEPPVDWYVSESAFANSVINGAKRLIYPFLAVRLLGFLPKSCSWPGYSTLASTAIAAAEDVLGKTSNQAVANAASFLVQCCTLKQLAAAGDYIYSPIDTTTTAETMNTFKAFAGNSEGTEVGKLKAYLESDYNRMDFGTIADYWNMVEQGNRPAETPLAASPEQPSADQEPAIQQSGSEPTQQQTAEPASTQATPAYAMPNGLDKRSYTLLQRMAVDEDQLMQALDAVTSGRYYGTPYLTTYQPGLSEKAIIQLLDRFTDKASHRHLTGDEADPRERKTVMIPPAFKVDQSQAIWTKAVVSDLGFPFINFTSPPVMELIKGTDPKSVKAAYRQVKGMFKRCGLKNPIDTLKEFAHAQYRNCALNSLVVDADSVFNIEPGQTMTVSIVDPYHPQLRTKGSFGLPLDFATAFYGVLSPVKAARQYAELCGMSNEEYTAYLAENGKPPLYVLSPKRAAFKRGPKGSLLHELFSSKTKPILVRGRVGNHDGGFLIPERIADLLFSV